MRVPGCDQDRADWQGHEEREPEARAEMRSDRASCNTAAPDTKIVLCVDEKSQIQALNRTAPILPLRPGLPEKATHDYKRNGTTTLFAALEVATGKVADQCYARHGKAEFLDFLKKVAKAYPRCELHVVLGNYHTHKHDDINRWLAKNPRITLHFTPTSGSSLPVGTNRRRQAGSSRVTSSPSTVLARAGV